MKSTTYQIINKTAIPGSTLQDALTWLLNNGGGGGGAPSGPAGGDLAGNYPNPTLAVPRVTQTAYDAFVLAVADALAQKQNVLVSGSNIKTVNGNSLVGAGDVAIAGGGGVTDHGALTGLVDDDHPQYHNDARGDARYSPLGHTHADAVAAGASGFMSGADKTKLNGIATNATANSSDAALRDRSTHTGTQAISTVVNLQTTLDGKESSLPAGGTTSHYLRGDKAWTDFATSVRAALLTGFVSGPNSAVAATDSVLAAIQKLQAQVSAGGGGGGATIKGIQRGTIAIGGSATSGTATITAVDTTKTEIRFLGGNGFDSGSSLRIPRLSLTNSTTITATMGATNGPGATTVAWELTEYN